MAREEEIVALNSKLESLCEQFSLADERAKSGVKNMKGELVYWSGRYQNVKDHYNSLVNSRNLGEVTKMSEFDVEEEVSQGMLRGRLNRMKSELRKAAKVTESIQNKELDTSKVAELTSLEKSIEESGLSKEAPKISQSLRKSIRSLEDGHSEGASLLAGAVIDFLLDELKSELNSADWNEAINKLETEYGLEENTEGRISRAVKEYRNIHSHEVDAEVETEESFIVLSGAIQLSKTVLELTEINQILK